MSILEFKPNKQLILDNSLNLKGLQLKPVNDMFLTVFENFKGFDLTSNPFMSNVSIQICQFLTKILQILVY